MKKVTYLMVLIIMTSLFTKAQTGFVETKINISKFIAYENNNRFFVNWSTDGTIKTNYFEIQGSTDGMHFSTMALVLGPDPSKPGDEYEYKDKLTIKNTAAFYRVVHISTSGKRQQSNIIKMMKLDNATLINPALRSKEPATL